MLPLIDERLQSIAELEQKSDEQSQLSDELEQMSDVLEQNIAELEQMSDVLLQLIDVKRQVVAQNSPLVRENRAWRGCGPGRVDRRAAFGVHQQPEWVARLSGRWPESMTWHDAHNSPTPPLSINQTRVAGLVSRSVFPERATTQRCRHSTRMPATRGTSGFDTGHPPFSSPQTTTR